MAKNKERQDKAYSGEEQYFYNLNKELIDRKRKELNAQRAEQRARELKAQHWMCCPKCGQQMEEIELLGIMVDRCNSCSGIYLDKGELELLLQSKEPKGFLGGLSQLFK
ncbi:MAG: zf-TFIIB domain-containing protein [Desulfobacteraceae bacterium]|jgi:hypothetical protein